MTEAARQPVETINVAVDYLDFQELRSKLENLGVRVCPKIIQGEFLEMRLKIVAINFQAATLKEQAELRKQIEVQVKSIASLEFI